MRKLIACLWFASLMSAASADMVYVSNEKDDTISVIDTATFSVVKTFPVGDRPRGIIFDRTGSVL